MSPFRSAAKPTPVRDPSAGNNPSSHIAYVLIPPISGQFHMMATVLVQLEGHGGYPGGQERGRPPTPLSFSAPTCRSMHHADFHGQVALVTGASSGMGQATAKAFAEAGAAVVLADLKAEAVGAAAQNLVAAGHTAIAVTCDVSDDAEVAKMVDRTIAEFGRLDAAFNNAGVMAH